MKVPIWLPVLLIQILQTIQEPQDMYDDDIVLAVPAVGVYHSPIDQPACRDLTIVNNCTCRESPNLLVTCFGKACKIFPILRIEQPLFKLKLTAIHIIKQDDLRLLDNIKILEIESNLKLVRIEPGCFKHMQNLTSLTISFNMNLKHLEENVFEGLVNVEYVSIQKNGFRHVIDVTRALPMKYMPRVMFLDLSENTFNEVQSNEFHPMNGSKLTELRLVLCEMEYIYPDTLEPLKYLKWLRIGQNLFNASVITNLIDRIVDQGIPLDNLNLYAMGLRKKIPTDMLEAIGRSNITFLHFTNNNFEHIDDDSFPYMPNLIKLSLRDDLIVDITNHAFRKLTNLKSLYLGQNKLLTVPVGILLETLVELDLAGNNCYGFCPSYFSIEDEIFKNMSTLQNLQLSYNNIGLLTKKTFIGLSNLTRLNLKNTSLYQIDNGAFLPLKKLQHLNLINNVFPLFMRLTADLFEGLTNLKVLLLGGCSIRNLTVTPSLFTHVPNLLHLGLERNQLHVIPPGQISHLRNLQSLSLNDNKLIPWTVQILPHRNLTYFAANQNKFTHVTTTMMQDWQMVNTLQLDGNPFTCDCSFYEVAVYLDQNWVNIQYNETDNFIAYCIGPEKWRRKPVVEYILYLQQDESLCDTSFVSDENLTIAFLVLLIIIIIISVLCYIYRWHISYYMFILRVSIKKHNLWDRGQFTMSNNYMYDAFVSYCNEDRNFVLKLVEKMEKYEPYLKLCIYERDFQIGSVISESVVQSVAVSKRTLLVISDAFSKSQWCRWETQLAKYHQIFFRDDHSDGPDDTLIMIRLEEVSKVHMTPILKYLMKTRIYLQWESDTVKQKFFWEKLRAILAAPKSNGNHS